MYAGFKKIENYIISVFVIILLVCSSTVCKAMSHKESVPLEDSSSYDKSFHFGISIEMADPKYSRFGLFAEKKIIRNITLLTGLKYAYGMETASVPGEFYKNKNGESLNISIFNKLILSIPMIMKIYPWQHGFNFLIGFHLDFLLLTPIVEPFGKKISNLMYDDLERNNIKGEFLKEISLFNRFKPFFNFGFGYNFVFGAAVGFSFYIPLMWYLNKEFFSLPNSILEAYYIVAFDFTKLFDI